VLQFALSLTPPHQYTGSLDVKLFFRSVASVFGPFIDHPTLRHATLAYCTASYDIIDPLQHLRHATSACSALRRKLNDPTTLDEGDLFASFLLALWARASQHFGALASNMLGFTLIMKQLFRPCWR